MVPAISASQSRLVSHKVASPPCIGTCIVHTIKIIFKRDSTIPERLEGSLAHVRQRFLLLLQPVISEAD